MKRLALLLVLISTGAYAEGPEYFQGSNGESGMITHGPGSITYYQSNRGSGMGTRYGNTIFWHGHGPGGSDGQKHDSRTDPLD